MATPLINGTNYSWGNIKLVLFGVPVVGITKIDYKKKQVKENQYGLGFEPVSRGYGNIEYEASIEIYVDELRRIKQAAPNRDLLAIPAFDIQVLYGGAGVQPATDVLRACEFLEDPLSTSQNDTKIVVSVPLIIAGIESL